MFENTCLYSVRGEKQEFLSKPAKLMEEHMSLHGLTFTWVKKNVYINIKKIQRQKWLFFKWYKPSWDPNRWKNARYKRALASAGTYCVCSVRLSIKANPAPPIPVH